MSRLLTVVLLLLALPGVALAQAVTIAIDHSDGGKTNARHLSAFFDALANGGCSTKLPVSSSASPVELVFDSRPVSIARKELPEYRLIAQARTLEGELKVRGAVVVHAARGINHLESLRGEWVSFVSKESWPGYRLPVKLLNEAGVKDSGNSFYFVGNHIGSISALLHRDVHVAVVAEPLAKRWAEANSLSIVAVTEEVDTGGWWMHQSVSKELTLQCAQAFSRLDRPRHKALPAWIDGFVVVKVTDD